MRRLALTKDGKMTYCTSPENMIGKVDVIILLIKIIMKVQKIFVRELKI